MRKSNKVIKNCRPISILSILSKILEKIVKCRSSNFIVDDNSIYSKQFEFRSGYCTSGVIQHSTDDSITALDNKLFSIVIFLDSSKAFKTIHKDIMLRKLDRLGVRVVTKIFLGLPDYNIY